MESICDRGLGVAERSLLYGVARVAPRSFLHRYTEYTSSSATLPIHGFKVHTRPRRPAPLAPPRARVHAHQSA
eukprot:scaffold82328_cov46-Phaeocystis_antarctica.AAC.2